MSLTVEEIKPGKCYAGSIDGEDDNYKVIAINERGILTYRTCTSPLRINIGVRQFATAVTQEMECPAGV